MAMVWCCSVFLTLASTNHITRYLKLQILKKCLSHYDVERHPKKERLTWIHRKEVLDRLSFRMCMFRYGCQPIKLQDSFVRNISWIGDWIILIFFYMKVTIKGRKQKTPFSMRWPSIAVSQLDYKGLYLALSPELNL